MLIALILSILSLVLIQTWSVLSGDYNKPEICKKPLLNKKAKPRTLNQYEYKPLIDDLKKKN